MRFIKSFLNLNLLAITILLQACSESSSDHQDTEILAVAGSFDNIIYVNGVKRTYHLHIPPSFVSSSKSELLIHLHGGMGNDIIARSLSGFDQISDQEGFIAVYPNAVNGHWNDGRDPVSSTVDDIGYIKTLINKLSTALNIGAGQVYMSGMSNGAIFAHRFACNGSEEISAIATVAGPMAIDIYNQCYPTEPVSVLMFHGRDDPFVLWDGGDILWIGGEIVNGGAVISVDETLNFWSTFNGCPAVPVTSNEPDVAPFDGTLVTRIAFDGCNNQTSVVLYDIEGGGHTWPGGKSGIVLEEFGNWSYDIDASLIIWDFFKNHTRQ